MKHRIVVTRRCLDDGDAASIRGLPGTARSGGALRPGAERRDISLDEWLAHVRISPTLVLVRLAANEEPWLRATHPARLRDRSSDRWLYWTAGEIVVEAPDAGAVAETLRLARALGARLRTDDTECFRGADTTITGAAIAAGRIDLSLTLSGGKAARHSDAGLIKSKQARFRQGGLRQAGSAPESGTDGARAGAAGSGPRDGDGGVSRRRTERTLLVAGTLVCVASASVLWMMQA